MGGEFQWLILAAFFLVILLLLSKALGSMLKAALLSAIAVAALYFALPYLESQQGVVGDTAKKAREATEDIDGTVESIKDEAVRVKDKLKEAAEVAKDGVETLKNSADAIESAKETLKDGES